MSYCESCERPLTTHISVDHVEPAKMCQNPSCTMGGVCLTCAMLQEWWDKVSAEAEPYG